MHYNNLIMESTELLYTKIKEAVAKTAGRELKTPRDFDYLSMRIFDTTKSVVSPTTLKRFWGYLKNENNVIPRLSTLDILSRFVGYSDWNSYCQSSYGINDVDSDFINNPTLYTTSLQCGDEVKLQWKPDRQVIIRYEGHNQFTVMQSTNSKLMVGDNFHCGYFIQNEPLHLTCLVRNGCKPSNYVCGRLGGIHYELNNKNK